VNEDVYYEIKYLVNDSNLDIEQKLSRIKDVIKGFKQPKKERELFKCLRCGWVWFPIKEPVFACPKCQSRKWNKPKKEDGKK
jgi:DNA-directed RNA polymerase subunit RPC12/RpoP